MKDFKPEPSDAEIVDLIMEYDDMLEKNTEFPVHERLQMGTAYGAGIRYARDRGLLRHSGEQPQQEPRERL